MKSIATRALFAAFLLAGSGGPFRPEFSYRDGLGDRE